MRDVLNFALFIKKLIQINIIDKKTTNALMMIT